MNSFFCQIHNNGPSNASSLDVFVLFPISYTDPDSMAIEELMKKSDISIKRKYGGQIDVKWNEADANRTTMASNKKPANSGVTNKNDRFVSNLNANRTIFLLCEQSTNVHCIEAEFTVTNFSLNSNISIIIDFKVDMKKVIQMTSKNNGKKVLAFRSAVVLQRTFDYN